jgi:predicted LPLAT superfamily acyltransferase
VSAAPSPSPAARGGRPAEWTRRAERGSPFLIRFIVWFSRRAGRGNARILLRIVAAYFFATAFAARRASGEYLARALGRAPTLGERWRLLFNFASTVHDRVFFLEGRHELFEVAVHGAEHFDEGGAILMGAHLGSFEAIRACARGSRPIAMAMYEDNARKVQSALAAIAPASSRSRSLSIASSRPSATMSFTMAGALLGSFEAIRACARGSRPIAMAMYEDNARKVQSALAAIAPAMVKDIVALGRLDAMLKLRERLEAGALIGVLADRTLGDEPVVELPFLGAPAPFPTGPMRMAAALRARVFFMTGLYRGGNRYEIHFEPLADFTALEGITRARRDALVGEAIARYAGRLEHYCRLAPDNFFNFHRFWK